jgi:hypothetical protein
VSKRSKSETKIMFKRCAFVCVWTLKLYMGDGRREEWLPSWLRIKWLGNSYVTKRRNAIGKVFATTSTFVRGASKIKFVFISTKF